MTFNMITFSLGFMSQHAEAAQENPALRATMPAQDTARVLEASSGQRRMLNTQIYDEWYGSSACYVNDLPNYGGKIDNHRNMHRHECEAACRAKKATACSFEIDDYETGEGMCSYLTSPVVKDCRYVNQADWDFDDPCEDWDGLPMKCKIFSTVIQKGADVYVGCFKDNTGGKRDLSERIEGGKNYKTCARICKRQGYEYFGRQWTNQCFCGNTYGSQGTATTCDCDNKSNVGGNVNCVYKTE
jgi:hypothetical protein